MKTHTHTIMFIVDRLITCAVFCLSVCLQGTHVYSAVCDGCALLSLDYVRSLLVIMWGFCVLIMCGLCVGCVCICGGVA